MSPFGPLGFCIEPTTIAYCSLCEFLEELRVPDEAAAIKFAEDIIGGRSGVATKGPYQVTLNNDVWTVRCSLEDGRPASIKIGKETGTEIASDFPR